MDISKLQPVNIRTVEQDTFNGKFVLLARLKIKLFRNIHVEDCPMCELTSVRLDLLNESACDSEMAHQIVVLWVVQHVGGVVVPRHHGVPKVDCKIVGG